MMKFCVLFAIGWLAVEALPADISQGSVETQVENPNTKAFYNSPIKPYKKNNKIPPSNLEQSTQENADLPNTVIVISKKQLSGQGVPKIRKVQLRKKSDSPDTVDAQNSAEDSNKDQTLEDVAERNADSSISGEALIQKGVQTPVITTDDEEILIVSRKSDADQQDVIPETQNEPTYDETDVKDGPATFVRNNPIVVEVKQNDNEFLKSETNPLDSEDLAQSASASKIYLLPPPSDMENIDWKESSKAKVYSVSRAQAPGSKNDQVVMSSPNDALGESKETIELKKGSKIMEEKQSFTSKSSMIEDGKEEQPARRFDESVSSSVPKDQGDKASSVIIITSNVGDDLRNADSSPKPIEPETSAEPSAEKIAAKANSPLNIQDVIYGKAQSPDSGVQSVTREDMKMREQQKLKKLGEEYQIPEELTTIKKDEEVLVPQNLAVSVKESAPPIDSQKLRDDIQRK